MRNFMNGISKGLAFVLAAAMVFTSVPSPVLADTLSLDTAVESNELVDAADVVDASAEISDSQVATDGDLIDSGIEVAAETADAADLDVTTEGEEGEEVPAEEGSVTRIMSIDFATSAASPATAQTTLAGYKYGQSNATVTATAKQGLAESKTTFETANIELYKVNVDEWVCNDRGDVYSDHAAAVAGVTGAFQDYIDAQVDYVKASSDTDKETAWTTAKVPITRNLTKMTNIPVSNTELPTGLGFTINKGVLTFKVTGAVTKAYDGWFVVKVYDTEGNPEIYTPLFNIKALGAFADASVNTNEVKFTVAPNANDNKKGTTDLGDDVYIKKVNGKNSSYHGDLTATVPADAVNADQITFGFSGNVEQDYTVYGPDETLPRGKRANDPDVVVGHKITITPDENVRATSAISDIQYKIVKEDLTDVTNTWFTVTADKTVLDQDDGNITLTVAPKAGLPASDDPYEAYLHVYHATAFGDEYIAKLVFNVGSNLSITPYINGEKAAVTDYFYALTDAQVTEWIAANTYLDGLYTYNGTQKKFVVISGHVTSAPAGGVYSPADGDVGLLCTATGTNDDVIYLGELPIGTPLATATNSIVFKAKGGVGGIEEFYLKGTDADKLNALGVDTELADTLNELAITGQFEQYDKLASTTTFTLASSKLTAATNIYMLDKEGTVVPAPKAVLFEVTAEDTKDVAVKQKYMLAPVEVDDSLVSMAIGDGTTTTPLVYGDANVYSWQAPHDLVDVTTASRTVTITNKTSADLTFDFTNEAATDFALTPAASIKVPKKTGTTPGTATFTVAPKNATTINSKDLDIGAAANNGLSTTTVTLSFKQAGDPFVVTKPAADDTHKNRSIIGTAEIGKPYEGYSFEYTKDASVPIPTFEITDVWTASAGTIAGWTNLTPLEATNVTGFSRLNDEDFAKFTEDYGLDVTLNGKLQGTPIKVADIAIQITAFGAGDYDDDYAIAHHSRTVFLSLTEPEFGTAFKVMSGTTNLSETKALTLEPTTTDAADATKATLSIQNLLGVDIKAVTAGVVTGSVKFKPVAGAQEDVADDTFKIIYDADDAALNHHYELNGIDIKKNSTANVILASNPAKMTKGGVYTAKVEVSSVNADYHDTSLIFDVTLTVSETPVLTPTGIGGLNDGVYEGVFVVGTPVVAGDNAYFRATYDANPNLAYTYTWADVSGSELTINDSGLKLETGTKDIDGKTYTVGNIIEKTKDKGPTKAGVLKVAVTATSTGVTPAVSTTKIFAIRINGKAKLTIKQGTDTIADNTTDNVVYVLPGLIKDATDGNKTTLTLANSTAEEVKGLKFTVENAADDRDAATKAKSDIKDIYTARNSKGTITISAPTSVPANGNATAEVTVATATPGEYKVKVTVTGTNVAKRQFWLYAVVSDKLAISVEENKTAQVGVKTYIEAKATGTKATDNVEWHEVTAANGTDETVDPVGGADDSNLVKAGFTDIFGDLNALGSAYSPTENFYKGTSPVINFNLQHKDATGATIDEWTHIRSLVLSDLSKDKAIKVDKSGKAISGAAIDDYAGIALPKIGTYKSYLWAHIDNGNLNTTAHHDVDGLTWTPTANYNGIYLAQDAWATINLTVTGTEAAKFETVSSTADTENLGQFLRTPNTYDLNEGIDGEISGIVPSKVNTYTAKKVTAGYTAGTGPKFLVGIKNGSDANLTDVKLILDNSKFTLANSGTIADKNANEVEGTIGTIPTPDGTAAKPYMVNLAAGKTTYFLVETNDDLAAGTYNVPLTMRSVDLKNDVVMNISLTVEAKSQLVTADYKAGAKLTTNKDTTYLGYVEDKKLSSIVTNNTLVNGAVVTLTTVNQGTDAAINDWLFIRNTGNTVIPNGSVTAVECTATGGNVTSASARKLEIAVEGTTDAGFSTNTASLGAIALPHYTDDVIDDYKVTYIRIRPRNAKTLAAGGYDSYIKIAVKDGNPASVIVPVHFVIAAKDLTNISHTPTSENITLTEVNEGYASTDATGGEFTITNTATANDGESKNFYNLTLAVNSANFKLIPAEKDKDLITSAATPAASPYTITKIAAGSNVSFKIVPVEGLKEGTYTTTFSISGGNLAATNTITKRITLKVNKNMNFTAKVYSQAAIETTALTDGVLVPNILTTYDVSFVKRMYRTMSDLKNNKAGNPYKVDLGSTGSDTQTMRLDVDMNGTLDTVIEFTKASGKTVIASVEDVGSMVIYRLAGQDLPDPEYTITGITDTDPEAAYFTSLTFKQYSVVTFMAVKGNEYINGVKKTYEKDNNLVAVVGTDADHVDGSLVVKNVNKYITGDGGNDALLVIVPNGSAAATSFTNGLPTVSFWDGSNAFESWQSVASRKSVDNKTYVSKDDDYVALWHGHTYPGSTDGDTEFIKWNWSSDHKQATVTVTCTKAGCPDADKGAIVLDSKKGDIAITATKKEADCENGERWEYAAKSDPAKMANHASYTCTVKTDEDPSTVKGHKYQPTVTWTYNETKKTYEPTIDLVCTVCKASDGMQHRTEKVTGSAITYTSEETKAKCEEKGSAKYEITSFTCVGKTYTPADFTSFTGVEWTKETELPAKGHNETPDLTVANFNEDTLAATVTATCPDCGKTIFGPAPLTATKNEDGTYKFSFTGNDGKGYTVEWANHKHDWKPSWSAWALSDPNDKTSWTTVLTLTCNVGTKPEVKKPAVTVTPTPDGDKYIDYVATATFAGTTYTNPEVCTVDAKTGERTSKHDHKWKLKGWSWESPSKATATFECTVGDKPEYDYRTATGSDIVKVKGPNSKGNSEYKATITGPDGKSYEDTKWFDASGNPTTGEGFGIEGLESEYKYTGKNITPDFVVMDYALDKVLTPSTDYSFKFSNNKNVGTATLTVTGKGNYGVKGGVITASFEIVDPMKDEDVSTYYDSVSGVKASKDRYTYDGTPKYPQTLEIKVKEGKTTSTVVAKLNSSGDGYDLPEGSKDLMIVVENNVKKGSGTVAVTGKDKRAKSATFSIGAADMSTLGDKLVVTADEAVYTKNGAKANVKVTFDGNDLVAGRDFTVSYKYTDKKNAGEKMGSVIVKGKNNFTKSAPAVQFDITKIALTDENVVVEAYDKTQAKSMKVSVYDAEGNAINKKFYSIEKIENEEGTDITKTSTKLEAGKDYEVTIKGDGKNVDETEYTVTVKAGVKLSSAKVDAKAVVKTYTGEPIELTDEDMDKISVSVKINKVDTKLVYGEDFEIIGYQNNNKKGSMKVIIKGIGDKVKGTKTFTVKVNPTVVKKGE